MMQRDDIIEIEIICTNYNVEPSFIDQLLEYGLLDVVTIDNGRFVELSKINSLERIIRMHYDLAINLEGIETIMHLLDRLNSMQAEMNDLRNRLFLYESD